MCALKALGEKMHLVKKTDPSEAATKSFMEFLVTSGHFQNQVEAIPADGDATDHLPQVMRGMVPYLGTSKNSDHFKRLGWFRNQVEIWEWHVSRLLALEARCKARLPAGWENVAQLEGSEKKEVWKSDPEWKELGEGIIYSCWTLSRMIESEVNITISLTYPELKYDTWALNKPYILSPGGMRPEMKGANPIEEIQAQQREILAEKKKAALHPKPPQPTPQVTVVNDGDQVITG